MTTKRRTAFITGATTGIGEAFAEAYARRGYDLVITGRRKNAIEQVGARLRSTYDVSVEVELAEFAIESDIERMADKIRERNNLEVLINNAGTCTNALYATTEWPELRAMLSCNCLATMLLTYAALPRMIANQHGDIVNVSSLAAFLPFPTNALYSASKAFINYFTETLYLELLERKVRIQALCPGMTRTNFHARQGLDTDKIYAGKGMMRAMMPSEVVAESLAALEKQEVICVPGSHNRRTVFFARHMPRRFVHKMMLRALQDVAYDPSVGNLAKGGESSSARR